MPKEVISAEGNLRNLGKIDEYMAEEREILDADAMAEMLYQRFENNVEELQNRGINLPPPTDTNGMPIPGYESQLYTQSSSGYNRPKMMPASHSEQALTALMDTRDDMLQQYASVSSNANLAPKLAMSIQRIESQIISLGGDVDRFDPSKYRSGLKPVAQISDSMETAKKVVENTKQVYTEFPIKEMYAGKNKSGKVGICIKLACQSGGQDITVRGTVVPKTIFSGNEAIDFIVDNGKGRMSVKNPNRGNWEDISNDYEVNWDIVKDS